MDEKYKYENIKSKSLVSELEKKIGDLNLKLNESQKKYEASKSSYEADVVQLILDNMLHKIDLEYIHNMNSDTYQIVINQHI